MNSWANIEANDPGTRDLHLDLHSAIVPGARGVRGQLCAALRDAIRSGRLTPASMLPPSRTLAADLGLARNTVAGAYAELIAEGWLASRQGTGTWVLNPGTNPIPVLPRSTPAAPVHNLMPGSPDVSEFPRNGWLASAKRALTGAPHEALRIGDPRGRIELRTALAEYLARVRGVRASPERIVICAGTRHAVEILGRALGGPVAIEAYGLFVFREALAAMGVASIPISVDGHGAVVAELDRTTATTALLTPAHHFPNGVPLHPSRRTAVLDWAHRAGGYLLEDDYDGEFRYDRQPIGSVQGLDPGRVVYLGSTSKSLTPALRLGWMVLPDNLIEPALAAAGGQQFHVNALTQLTVADFITTGGYDRHIRRMRLAYRRRRDRLVTALGEFDGIGIGGLSAGLHLQLTLPAGTEDEALRRAAAAGIALSGLDQMRHPDTPPQSTRPDGLVVGFGAPAGHAFDAAVDALCGVLADITR